MTAHTAALRANTARPFLPLSLSLPLAPLSRAAQSFGARKLYGKRRKLKRILALPGLGLTVNGSHKILILDGSISVLA